MRQQTLADGSFEKFRKKNRKELFLDDMEQIVPWQDLCGVIEPYYPKPEGAGRGPVGIERKLLYVLKVLKVAVPRLDSGRGLSTQPSH